MGREKEPASTCTTKDVAYALGCTVQFVGQLESSGKIEKLKRDTFDTREVFRRLVELERKKNNEEKQTIDAANLRLVAAKASLEELKLQHERGEVISTGAAVTAWSAVVKNVRQKLLSIPTKAARTLITCKTMPEIKEALERHICEVLTELVNPELKEDGRK